MKKFNMKIIPFIAILFFFCESPTTVQDSRYSKTIFKNDSAYTEYNYSPLDSSDYVIDSFDYTNSFYFYDYPNSSPKDSLVSSCYRYIENYFGNVLAFTDDITINYVYYYNPDSNKIFYNYHEHIIYEDFRTNPNTKKISDTSYVREYTQDSSLLALYLYQIYLKTR